MFHIDSLQELASKRLDALHLRSMSEGAYVAHITKEILTEILPETFSMPDITSVQDTITLRVSSSLEAHILYGKQMELKRKLYKRLFEKKKFNVRILQKQELLQNPD